MKYNITINHNGTTLITEANEGENLLDILIKHDINIDAPCGGNGTCGKCKVKIIGDIGQPEKEEQKFLGDLTDKGYRLACFHKINNDIDVIVKNDEKASIMTKGIEFDIKSDPVVSKKVITIDDSTLNDQRSLLRKIIDKTGLKHYEIDVEMLNKINSIVDNNNEITCVYNEEELVNVEDGNTINENYSLAVDIGTTTVACYLIDLVNEKEIAVKSFMNPQKRFGADVISRIDYINNNGNLKVLKDVLIKKINDVISEIISEKSISRESIYSAFFAGNTTMIHLFLGLNPEKIAKAPFIPITNYSHKIKAENLGISISKKGCIFTLPMVASYIGADTTAAVLASRMSTSKEISLLMDLGTNGEIVLGNSEFMFACSAAAGPAFEGANIRDGMAGINGAIDDIKLEIGEVKINTIGNQKPVGICGSAIIDIVAELLKVGIIDETGRILENGELEKLNTKYAKRVINIDGFESFLLVDKENSGTNNEIVITQKDIREIQNAKAAIAAGVQILLEEANIKVSDVNKVFLAGGFGSYIDIHNTAQIGLIPSKLEDKVISIGNAAGSGAILTALSVKEYNYAKEISGKIKYIELSSNLSFTNKYVEEMIFGKE